MFSTFIVRLWYDQRVADKAHENRIRRAAERQGFTLIKSRVRDPLALDYGWHIRRGRRELARFRELDQAEHWLANPESREEVTRSARIAGQRP